METFRDIWYAVHDNSRVRDTMVAAFKSRHEAEEYAKQFDTFLNTEPERVRITIDRITS